VEGFKDVLKKVLITGAIALWLLGIPFIENALAAPFDAEAAVTNAQVAADTAFMLI
jgi:Amt family ammonium transporter